jgi:hypothetical protein
MALLVDPSRRDNADERPSAEEPTSAATTGAATTGAATTGAATTGPATTGAATTGAAGADAAATGTAGNSPAAEAADTCEASTPRLAEPPLTGGHVEALMGRLIRVLSHSRLARPFPAVLLSVIGLCGVAFVGLCATTPTPSAATPPVLLPLTNLARLAGAPHLSVWVTGTIMYIAVTLCTLGLAMMLWANSHGWSPDPRKVFWTAAAGIAALVNVTPVGSGDIASYAAYGKIAALGFSPYAYAPSGLPGGKVHNPYTMLVSPYWQDQKSVYGPVATWVQQFAAWIGGDKTWLTIQVLMVLFAAAFLATGYILLRTAENPVRAVLLWTANPLLIVELVMGGHLDVILALATIAAVTMSRRWTGLWRELEVGLLVGVAGAIKVNAVFVALAIAVPLLHNRDWWRLLRVSAVIGATTFGLYIFSYGLSALLPALDSSSNVISPTLWRFVQMGLQHFYGKPRMLEMSNYFGFIWPVLLILLAWYLYKRLSPDVPTVVAVTCALTFAWIVVAPWVLPWYSAVAWVALALLPRNTLTRWLTLATATLGLLHFNGGGHATIQIGPTP